MALQQIGGQWIRVAARLGGSVLLHSRIQIKWSPGKKTYSSVCPKGFSHLLWGFFGLFFCLRWSINPNSQQGKYMETGKLSAKISKPWEIEFGHSSSKKFVKLNKVMNFWYFLMLMDFLLNPFGLGRLVCISKWILMIDLDPSWSLSLLSVGL